MIKRALIAVTVSVLAVALCGCPKRPTPNEPAAGTTSPTPTPAVGPVPAGPTGPIHSDLETIAVSYRQIGKLLKKKKLVFPTIEARSWLIAGKARELVDKYEHHRPIRGIDPKKAALSPELIKLKFPELIKDLDLVAINAKRLAMAAARWDAKEVRENFANLKKAADRCLPAPAPAPVPAQPADPADPAKAPASPVSPAPAKKAEK